MMEIRVRKSMSDKLVHVVHGVTQFREGILDNSLSIVTDDGMEYLIRVQEDEYVIIEK